ncbi:MAG TPA: isoprenylcysteine carboxylmethyltransferase family protein [Gemmatimonadaceae bacterium]
MFYSILRYVIPGLWLAWYLYWMGAARDVKATRWHESALSQLLHRTLLLVAAVLMIEPYWSPAILNVRILPRSTALFVFGVAMLAAGLGFSIWARRHLGRNWSATVTLKEDHTLIRTGPYAYVRHPIYSGVLFAILGTAMAIDEWRGVAAVLFALMAFIYKITAEDRRLRETFPHFEQYRQQTAALIPFVF